MILACPNCTRQVQIPDEYVGKHVRCPLCQGVFQADAPAAAPPPPQHQPPPSWGAPPAPQPQPSWAPPAPPPQYAPPEPPPRHEPDWPSEAQAPHGGTEAALNRGANLLLVSAILFTVMGVGNFILELILAGMVQFRGSDYMAAAVVGSLFLVLVFIGTPVVFLFLGASFLRKARYRGIVLTACILGIILASLGTLGVLGLLVGLGNVDNLYRGRQGGAVVIILLKTILVLGGVVFGFIASISGLTLLNRPDVRRAYGVHEPRYRRPRYDDRYDDDYRY